MWKAWSFQTGAPADSVAPSFASSARPPSSSPCLPNSAGRGAEGAEETENAEPLSAFSVLSVYSEATTKILAARFTRTKDSVRPVAWLACVTLGNLGRTLVHHPPALDLEQLLGALADILRGLFATM